MIRVGKPHKQLMYRWVVEALNRFPASDTCLDIACGYMQLYPYVRAAHYVGIDIDAKRLAKAVQNYPAAVPRVCEIENLGAATTGDLVLCLQVIGQNVLFDNQRSLAAVAKCLSATRSGGRLIIGVGPRAAEYQDTAAMMLREAFAVVDEHRYGAFHQSLPKSLSWLVSSWMMRDPSRAVSSKHPSALFICEGRT